MGLNFLYFLFLMKVAYREGNAPSIANTLQSCQDTAGGVCFLTVHTYIVVYVITVWFGASLELE